MPRNYFLSAQPNFTRQKLCSFINTAGLVALACVALVVLLISDELSYDRWIAGTQNLHPVEKIARAPGRNSLELAVVSFVLPTAIPDAQQNKISYQMQQSLEGKP